MARNILLDAPSISKRKGFQKDLMKKNKRPFSKNKKIIPRGEKQERGRFNSGQLQSAALNHAGFPRASRHCIPHRGPTAERGGEGHDHFLAPGPLQMASFCEDSERYPPRRAVQNFDHEYRASRGAVTRVYPGEIPVSSTQAWQRAQSSNNLP